MQAAVYGAGYWDAPFEEPLPAAKLQHVSPTPGSSGLISDLQTESRCSTHSNPRLA